MSLKHYAEGSTYPPLQDGVLRIYSMEFCPYAQRTRIVLHHKQIPHEIININLKNKPEWFKAKTVTATVPVLEKGDQLLFESTATSDWLDDTTPDNRLTPSDPYRRAWDRVLVEYFGKLSGAFYSLLRRAEEPEVAQANVFKHVKFYEDVLAQRGGPFFGGDSPAMVDFMLWPHIERFPVVNMVDPKIDLSFKDFPKMEVWEKKMKTVPAVQKTYIDPATHAAFFKTHLAGEPDYDMLLKE